MTDITIYKDCYTCDKDTKVDLKQLHLQNDNTVREGIIIPGIIIYLVVLFINEGGCNVFTIYICVLVICYVIVTYYTCCDVINKALLVSQPYWVVVVFMTWCQNQLKITQKRTHPLVNLFKKQH